MKKPIAIQLVSTGGFYGAERVLLELAVHLRDNGWDSRILVLEGRGAKALLMRAGREGLAADAFVPDGRLALLPMAKRLRRTLAAAGTAIVHSHGYKPDILLSLLRMPRRLACFSTCHNWIGDSAGQRVLEWVDKRVLRSFDTVVGVSAAVVDKLLRAGVPPAKVVRIDNGIGMPTVSAATRARVRSELGVSDSENVVIQIGRLSREKRNALLLRVMARMPRSVRWKLVFVGDGDQRQELQVTCSQLGISDQVVFAGYRDDAIDFLAGADLLALTSDNEGLPVTILEAMAIGCPILSTDVGAIPRVLENGKSAWIVPARDEVMLTTVMLEALQTPVRARQLAACAQTEFHRKYSRQVMGDQYLNLYRLAWARRGWV